jgi:hypothetical protein
MTLKDGLQTLRVLNDSIPVQIYNAFIYLIVND